MASFLLCSGTHVFPSTAVIHQMFHNPASSSRLVLLVLLQSSRPAGLPSSSQGQLQGPGKSGNCDNSKENQKSRVGSSLKLYFLLFALFTWKIPGVRAWYQTASKINSNYFCCAQGAAPASVPAFLCALCSSQGL